MWLVMGMHRLKCDVIVEIANCNTISRPAVSEV